jgi:hypothetical protein
MTGAAAGRPSGPSAPPATLSPSSRSRRFRAGGVLEGVFGIAVVAAKLALVYGRLFCPRLLPHDDLLFLQLGRSILDTGWLGPYQELTLVKGPFLPMFLAASAKLGVPFLLGQDLLYLLASAVMVLALAPVVVSRTARVLLFALCVFNPATMSSDPTVFGVGGAVLTRELLYASLSLLVIAASIALWTYRERSRHVRLAWALVLGSALGALWLAREEGVWIVPSLLLAFGVTVWWLVRRPASWPERVREAVLLAIPLALWAAAIVLVSTLNWWHYGVFTTNELHTRPVRAAYGALTRVRHPEWTPNLPVPRAVRARIYAVSPAFRELEPALEDERGGWFGYGCPSYPHTCGDLAGGWFFWALRDAVTRNGHHATAGDAAAYYLRLAGEINAACASGRLDCDGPRETLIDPISWAHLKRLPGAMAAAFGRTVQFSDVYIVTEPCVPLDPGFMRVYAQVTRHAAPAPAPPAGRRIEIASAILALYQGAVPPLTGVALLGYLASIVALGRLREAPLVVPGTLILLAMGARFALLAVADVISTVPYSPRYYQPLFALLLLFVGLNTYALLQLGWRSVRTAPHGWPPFVRS